MIISQVSYRTNGPLVTYVLRFTTIRLGFATFYYVLLGISYVNQSAKFELFF